MKDKETKRKLIYEAITKRNLKKDVPCIKVNLPKSSKDVYR